MDSSNTLSLAASKKQDSVLGGLRSRIVDGRWRPGDRIPTLRDLGASFDVSTVTVQKAIDQLNRDGFIRSKNRVGMFVSERPPCLNRFALVLPFRPRQNQHWSFYWEALCRSAVEVGQRRGVEIVIHYEIDAKAHATQDYDRLVGEVMSDRIAGMLFAHSPHTLRNTPVMNRAGIPKIAFMSGATEPGVGAVTGRIDDWFGAAIKRFKKLGRRRIAVLFAAHEEGGIQAPAIEIKCARALRAAGMESKPGWTQAVLAAGPRWASNLMQLMFNSNQKERPNGLLITDDNLAEQAQAGLIQAGMRVPEDLDVISLANFPCPPAAVLPIHRIGFDARTMMETSIDLLLAKRRGEKISDVTVVPVVSAEEAFTRNSGQSVDIGIQQGGSGRHLK